jgi:hypothetical protein
MPQIKGQREILQMNLSSIDPKLLWTIISLLIALSRFVVINSIFIYQKVK